MHITFRNIAQVLILAAALLLPFTTAQADDKEFDAITRHLKSHFNAKRRSIPLMGLAKLAVKFARPAGVKSIKVAIFEELKFSGTEDGSGMAQAMRQALSQDWQPLVRIRQRSGEQTYVYARDEGKNIKLMVVSLQPDEAFVARVKISPDALAKFVNNPKILGISLNQ
jgi:hypothetical protein